VSEMLYDNDNDVFVLPCKHVSNLRDTSSDWSKISYCL